MRLVSHSAIIAALMAFPLLAPSSAAADDVPHKQERLRAPKKPPRRHWGAEELVPTSRRTDLKKSVLPDALVAFDARTNKIGVIRPLDEVAGIPVAGAKTPRDAAETYLRLHHEVLGLSDSLEELRPSREVDGINLKVFHYDQIHSGLPVIDGDLSVSVLTKSLTIAGVGAHLVPITARTAISPAKDSAAAIQALVEDVQRRYPSKPDDRVKPTAEPAILVRDGVPTAVWRVKYRTADGSWNAVVAAGTNEIISVRDNRIYN